MNDKKILITGGKGFIGSHLAEALPEADILDLKDGNDIRICEIKEDYDYIFHLAANASIPQSLNNPIESHSHNVVGTLRLLEYAKTRGTKIIFSSSSSVYGEPKELPIKEEAGMNPMIPYGVQKLECELYLNLYFWLYNVKSCALRYFNVYGERQEIANGGGDSSLALANFIKQKKNGEPLTIVGTGEQRRDFIYVKDVVDANLKAMEYLEKAENFQGFNIGIGKNYSMNEIADIFGGERTYLPARIEPLFGLADITKAKNLLDWEPKGNLEQWIKNQINGTK